ncbi:MAG: tetratricopeptide repeat protein [Chlorogloeopsis fritschii C42_A2020_084]|uniref:tetratricopeptide repeat protein n=1 Tax=Chlorogloeopsis fritschii TaxID=1124 RepID=UPI0019EAE962|nr:tetratricopeptide repeat protein [Chlorogloeopsis fritschii]MBF2007285.1 tetratricopeptide repeat protein [Chlorogloeopsis fritschii C42_A2020_084]
MNYCYRLIGNLIIAFTLTCFFLASPAHSLATSFTQVTANDLFQLGVENMLHGNYHEAIKVFQQAIEKKQDFVAAYSNRCLANLKIEDYQAAIADCTQVINWAPDKADAYLNRGLAYYRQGNYQAAIADDEKAIALKPYDFRAYYNRGVAQASLANYQQAIADYNLALSQIPHLPNPLVADIYNDRGLARLQLTNLQAAMHDFNMAIRLNAADDRAFFNRGCACAKNEDYASAVRNFTEVIQLNPSDGHAYINRGIALHHLGYEQSAIADLKKAAKHFGYQGEKLAYEKTLSLIKIVRQQIPSTVEIALVEAKV